jgi:hypothetical protein
MTEHVVENIDMLVLEARGAGQEQCGDAAQRFDALMPRAVLQYVFQLRDQ